MSTIIWLGDKLDDLMNRGRAGEIWAEVGKAHGGVGGVNCAQRWFAHATEEDKSIRAAAILGRQGRRTFPARHQGPRIPRVDGPVTFEPACPKSPAKESMPPNAFGRNNVNPIEYGKTPLPELGHSATGCAAAMVCG